MTDADGGDGGALRHAEAAGTATFTVNVTDTAGGTLAQPYTLTVNGALTIDPTTLLEATAGTATNQTITVSGGTTPYTTLNVLRILSPAAPD